MPITPSSATPTALVPESVSPGYPREPNQSWTEYTLHSEANIVYVDDDTNPNASDENPGATPELPMLTLSAAIERAWGHGHPDHRGTDNSTWILLRRGGVWQDQSFVQLNSDGWIISGRSTEYPFLIGSYGSSPTRPKVQTPTTSDIDSYGFYKSRTVEVNYVAIVGIHFDAYVRDGSETTAHGINFWGTGSYLHVEDCYIENYKNGISFKQTGSERTPPIRWPHHLSVYRTHVYDSFHYGYQDEAQGIFAGDWPKDITIEECILDHNGWNEERAGEHGRATDKNHNVYFTGPGPWEVRRCWLGRGAGQAIHGNKTKSGIRSANKVVVENVACENALGLTCGVNVESAGRDDNDGSLTVYGNVVNEGRDIHGPPDPQNPDGERLARCAGIHMGDLPNAGSVCSQNLVINNTLGTAPGYAFRYQGLCQDAIFEYNLTYNWNSGLVFLNMRESGRDHKVILRGNLIDIHDAGVLSAVIKHEPEESLNSISSSNNTFWSSALPDEQWVHLGPPTRERHTLDWWLDYQDPYGTTIDDDTSVAADTVFTDPDRSVVKYTQDVLGVQDGTYDDFVDRLKQQGRGSGPLDSPNPDTWSPALNMIRVINWIREGFDLSPLEE